MATAPVWSGKDLRPLIEGSKPVWERFVRDHAGVIYAAVNRKLRPAGAGEEVEDVAQDVFVKLCRENFKLLRSFDAERAKLTTWLTVIATSVAIDHLRRRKPAASDIDSVPERYLAEDPPAPPARITIPEGLLSPRQALVMELLYTRDMDPGEAAEVMGVDAQTVRSMHHKALTKLRQHFKDQDDGG